MTSGNIRISAGLALLAAGLVLPGAAAASNGLDYARAMVMSAHPEICDPELPARFDGFVDTVYEVSWPSETFDGSQEERHGRLYEINCYVGAYNVVAAYVFAAREDAPEDVQLVSFAAPAFFVEYSEDDTTQTELAADPEVRGFSAETLLVNPSFDPDTLTISTDEKWRGLGDAWSAGRWMLESGRFVLKEYVVDPIYEANLEEPSEDQANQSFTLYSADN